MPTTQPAVAVWKLTEVARNYEHILRECKVVKFVTNRKGICDFLLAVNSNLGHILHGFGAKVTLLKSHLAHTPV